MKSAYKKPVIHIEYLALNQTVASGCGATPGGDTLGKPAHWSKATCGWYMDDNTILWVGDQQDVLFHSPKTEMWVEYVTTIPAMAVFSVHKI